MPPGRLPVLSIIVPLLDEIAELEPLLANLALQEGVDFEVLLCDGGSLDGTIGLAAELAGRLPLRLALIRCGRGRATQMNAGARAARGHLLLFLHADSRFPDGAALARAVAASDSVCSGSAVPSAARFGLIFRRTDPAPSLAYFYHEAKARLPRGECIRGDQGFLLSRESFDRIGGFDESLPFLEDLRMALAIEAAGGSWSLLPAEILTSARRFEREGFLRRQILNAIIVNNLLAGWDLFFRELPGLYRRHAETGRLQLYPLLDGIRRLLREMPAVERHEFWRTTGRHVARNSWQIFFWLDVRSAYLRSAPPGAVRLHWTSRFERLLAPRLASEGIAAATATAVRLWHRGTLLLCRIAERP